VTATPLRSTTVGGEGHGRGRIVAPGFIEAKEVGRGGFATVYAARMEATGDVVALKVFHTPDAEGRRVRRELVALERLAGIANVVPVLGVTTSVDGKPVMVMPFLPSTMAERIALGGADPRTAVKWLGDIATALDGAAALGVHHRDIKPGNVLIDAEGGAHLADFGISALGGIETGTTTAMAFSPPYAAPERLEGRDDIDLFRSDIYSLAATTWTSIDGDAPFGTATTGGVTGLILRVMANQLQKPPSMPDALFEVLRVGMALDPAERYPSGTALAAAALQAMRSLEDPTVSRASSRERRPPRSGTLPTVDGTAWYSSTPSPSEDGSQPDDDVAEHSSADDLAESRSDGQSPLTDAGFDVGLPSGARRTVTVLLAVLLAIGVGTVAMTILRRGDDAADTSRTSNLRSDIVPTLCTIRNGRSTLSPGVEWGVASPQTATLTADLTCGLADARSDLNAPAPSTQPPRDPGAPMTIEPAQSPTGPAPNLPPATSPATTGTMDRDQARWLDGTLELTADFDSLGFEGGTATATGNIDWEDDRSTVVESTVAVSSSDRPAISESSSAYDIALTMTFSEGFGAKGGATTGPMAVTATFDPATNRVAAIESINGSFAWSTY